MMIEMPYIAVCRNHALQNRLADELATWAERLNPRLIAQGKSPLSVTRVESIKIEGPIEVSSSLQRAFPTDQLDNGVLLPSLLLNGIHIEIPQDFDSPETLSLTFIQADNAPFDGLAVRLARASEPEPVQTASASLLKIQATMFSMGIGGSKRNSRHATISQTCFMPRLHEKWFAALLAVLQTFDPDLHLEIGAGFLPAPQLPAGVLPDFTSAMDALADEYLATVADGIAGEGR